MKYSSIAFAIAATLSAGIAVASDVTVNGFASVGVSKTDNKSGYAGATDTPEFESESKLGVQGTFRPNDNVEAMVQLVASAQDTDGDMNRDDWEPEITWAYLGYEFENGTKVRGGKLRLPLFMLSDYLDVTYAMPWVRGPEEVYGKVIINSFTGADVSYDLELDDSSITFQGFYGNKKDIVVNGTDVDKLLGASATWSDDILTLRAGYTQGSIETPAYTFEHPTFGPVAVSASSDKANFASLGFRYEDHGYQVLSEVTQTEIEGGFSDNISGYVSLGYSIDSITPYVMFAHVETTDDDEHATVTQATAPIDRDAYSVGLRWDIQPGLALKGDVTYAENNLSDADRAANSFELNGEEDTYIYTIKVDATF
ncbi:porin [Vibrio makurazakiensis]|uniref:porin n=1 Tax=Vibrio makurazakiensis TaxID=2910250 RepID=UPI003D0EA4DF